MVSISSSIGLFIIKSITMKNIRNYLFAFFILLLINSCSNDPSDKFQTLFNYDWKFYQGEIEGAEKVIFDDSNWRNLNLPHDFSIEQKFDPTNPSGKGGGFSSNGIGWYRKQFVTKNSMRKKKVQIQFDGIYRNSKVWINGHFLGFWPYGYTTFQYDLTPYLNPVGKENLIAVKVDTKDQPNSRWYSGAGIYRNTWLKISGKLHFDKWGVEANTISIVENRARIAVKAKVINEESKDLSGILVLRLVDNMNNTVRKERQYFLIQANDTSNLSQELYIPKAELWSIENPYLYQLKAELHLNGKITDLYQTNYGIRNFVFSPNEGFYLNGEIVKIKGTNNHHAGGPLGAACFDYTYERQLKLLKEAGCNALRMSHNPPSPAMLDAADKLGFIVFNEVFDEWKRGKLKAGYAPYFDEWHAKDIENWVKRDRNHPSVFAWSIGNEVAEQGDRKNGRKIAQMLKDEVRKHDATRPVTAGNNKVNGINATGIGEVLDIVGYNYQESMYEADHEKYPNRVIYGSETTVYPYQPGDCSQMHTYEEWVNAQTADFVMGEFLWTGFDYLGESGLSAVGTGCEPWNEWPEWPWIGSASGFYDICGFKKPAFYHRKALWTEKPMVYMAVETDSSAKNIKEVSYWGWPAVEPHWNHQKEGDLLSVHVYTNVENVELKLNGRSLGEQHWKLENEAFLVWEVPYEKGTLEAIATLPNGKTVSHTLKTAGKPAQLVLKVDRESLQSNAQDLVYVQAFIQDENGILLPFASNQIEFEVTGPGKINAVGNGNLKEYLPFKSNKTKAYKGKCLAIVQSTTNEGEILVQAKMGTISSNKLTISSKK